MKNFIIIGIFTVVLVMLSIFFTSNLKEKSYNEGHAAATAECYKRHAKIPNYRGPRTMDEILNNTIFYYAIDSTEQKPTN